MWGEPPNVPVRTSCAIARAVACVPYRSTIASRGESPFRDFGEQEVILHATSDLLYLEVLNMAVNEVRLGMRCKRSLEWQSKAKNWPAYSG